MHAQSESPCRRPTTFDPSHPSSPTTTASHCVWSLDGSASLSLESLQDGLALAPALSTPPPHLHSPHSAPTSSPQTCTWLRTARVTKENVLQAFLTFSPLDPMLGTGLEARRVVGTSLCQVGVRRHRCSRSVVNFCVPVSKILADVTRSRVSGLSGPRAGLATPEVAQRLVLRRDTQHGQVSLHILLFAQFRAQVLDTRRARLSDIQPHIFVVRPRAL